MGAHPVSGAHRTQGCESPRGKTPAPQPLDARRTSAPPGVSSSLARQPPRCEPAPQVEPCVQSRVRRAVRAQSRRTVPRPRPQLLAVLAAAFRALVLEPAAVRPCFWPLWPRGAVLTALRLGPRPCPSLPPEFPPAYESGRQSIPFYLPENVRILFSGFSAEDSGGPDLLSPVQPCPARGSQSEAPGLPSCCSHGPSSSSGSPSSPDSSGRPSGRLPGVRWAGPQRPAGRVPPSHPQPRVGPSSPGWLRPTVPVAESPCCVQITWCDLSPSLLIALCWADTHPVKTVHSAFQRSRFSFPEGWFGDLEPLPGQ